MAPTIFHGEFINAMDNCMVKRAQADRSFYESKAYNGIRDVFRNFWFKSLAAHYNRRYGNR